MSQYPGPGFEPAHAPDEPYGYPPEQPYVARAPQAWGQYGTPTPQAWPQSYGYPGAPGQPVPAIPAALPATSTDMKQSRLGGVGLALTGMGAVLLCISTVVWGVILGPMTPDQDLSDRQYAVILPSLLLSSLVVVAGWVVGIVATAINRGRGFGIATIVLGVLAPLLALGAMVVAIATTS